MDSIHSLFRCTFKQLFNKAENVIAKSKAKAARLLEIASSGARAGAYANPLSGSRESSARSQGNDASNGSETDGLRQGELSFSLAGILCLDEAIARMATRCPDERSECLEKMSTPPVSP